MELATGQRIAAVTGKHLLVRAVQKSYASLGGSAERTFEVGVLDDQHAIGAHAVHIDLVTSRVG